MMRVDGKYQTVYIFVRKSHGERVTLRELSKYRAPKHSPRQKGDHGNFPNFEIDLGAQRQTQHRSNIFDPSDVQSIREHLLTLALQRFAGHRRHAIKSS